jgi:predicted nucleic acid-binding protein
VTIVIDSSVTLGWTLADERTDATASVLRTVAENGAVAPSIWPIEVANSLSMAVRRNRISTATRDRHLADLATLTIVLDKHTAANAWSRTLRLVDAHGLTVYDATYLELALRRQLPLATLDKAMIAAAARTGVTVLP